MKKLCVLILLFWVFGGVVISAQIQDGRGVGVTKSSPEKRQALVIGNSDYKIKPLPNPQNDAADMKAVLESLGFEVLYGVNQNGKQMKALIRQFGDKLAQNKGIGLFYFSGHGLASGGENYLVPVDAEIPAEDEIADAAVSLSFLLNKLEFAQNSMNIVILDACRNNPFAKQWRTVRDTSSNGGLVSIKKAPGETLIAYATAPGEVADDGPGRNGLYTEVLIQQMKRPDLKLEDVFKNVRSEVRKKSKNSQIPWESTSIERDFYFSGGTSLNNTARINNRPVIENRIPEPKPTPKQSWIIKSNFFIFELHGCRISGSSVICQFTIINEDNDRKLMIQANCGDCKIYDEKNNSANASGAEIANSGKRVRPEALLGKDRKADARLYFEGISPNATEISRMDIKLCPQNGNCFFIKYKDIPLIDTTGNSITPNSTRDYTEQPIFRKKEIKVYANSKEVDSGVDVVPGSKVEVTVSGFLTRKIDHKPIENILGSITKKKINIPNSTQKVYSDALFSIIKFSNGKSTGVRAVGPNKTFTVSGDETGRLFFAIDNKYKGSEGFFIVTIKW
jgi:hypothetical protein